MEEKLLKIFKLAEQLNTSNSNVYVQLQYAANDSKKLDIAIVSKKDFSYIERCSFQLNGELIKCDNFITLLEIFVGGASHE